MTKNVLKRMTTLFGVLPLCFALAFPFGRNAYAEAPAKQESSAVEISTGARALPVLATGTGMSGEVTVRYLMHSAAKSLDLYTDSAQMDASLALFGFFTAEDMAADPTMLLLMADSGAGLFPLWTQPALGGMFDSVTVHGPAYEGPDLYLPEQMDTYSFHKNLNGQVDEIEESWAKGGRTVKISRDESGRIRMVRRTTGSLDEGDPTLFYLGYETDGRINACVFPGINGSNLAAEDVLYDENGRLYKMTGVQPHSGDAFDLTIVWTAEGTPVEVILQEGSDSVSLTLYYRDGRITTVQKKRSSEEAVLYEEVLNISYTPETSDAQMENDGDRSIQLSLGPNFLDLDGNGETDCLRVAFRTTGSEGDSNVSMLSVVSGNRYDVEAFDGTIALGDIWLVREQGRSLVYVNSRTAGESVSRSDVFDVTDGVEYLGKQDAWSENE